MPSLSSGIESVKKWGVTHIHLTLLAFLFGILFAVITVIAQTFEIPMIYFIIFFGLLYRLINFKNMYWIYKISIIIIIFLGLSVLVGENERRTLQEAFKKQFSLWNHISVFSFYILFGTFMYAYLV